MNEIKEYRQTSLDSSLRRLHPYQILAYVSMAVIGVLLSGLSIILLFQKIDGNTEIILPKSFVFSTLILFTSSFTIKRALRFFEQEEFRAYRRWMKLTLFLGVGFAALQITAWFDLFQSGYFIDSQIAVSYLYITSAIHLFHVVFAISLVGIFFYKSLRLIADPVKYLLYSTLPLTKIQISLLERFWHFLDITWIALFLVFLIKFL